MRSVSHNRVWNHKDPFTGSSIFFGRLEKAGFESDGVFVCSATWKDITEARKIRPRFLVARFDGVQHEQLSGRNIYGFVKQRRPALLPAAKAAIWVPDLPASLSEIFNRYLNKRAIWLLRNADVLVFQSQLSRNMCREYLSHRPGDRPETVIFNAVDLDEFRPRKTGKLDGSPAVIIACAIHRLSKRLPQAIRLINCLADDFPRIHLHVLGAFDPLVEAAVSTLDTSRCTFHGRIHHENLATFYSGADVQLSLGVLDPCPNVVCEGLASGLPVLTPAESGAAELIGPANGHWAIQEGIKLETYQSAYVAALTPSLPVDPYIQAFQLIMDDLSEARRRARARAEAALDIRSAAAKYTDFVAGALSNQDVPKPHTNPASS